MLEELLNEWPKIAIGFVGGIGLLFAFGNVKESKKQKSTIQRIQEKHQELTGNISSANAGLNNKMAGLHRDIENLRVQLANTDLEAETRIQIQKIQNLAQQFELAWSSPTADRPDELQTDIPDVCVAETSNKGERCKKRRQKGKLICSVHEPNVRKKDPTFHPDMEDLVFSCHSTTDESSKPSLPQEWWLLPSRFNETTEEETRNTGDSTDDVEAELFNFITDDNGYLFETLGSSDISDFKRLTAYIVKGEGELPKSPTKNLKILSAVMDIETGENGQTEATALQVRSLLPAHMAPKDLGPDSYWKIVHKAGWADKKLRGDQLLTIAPDDFTPVKSGKRQLKIVTRIVPAEMDVKTIDLPTEISPDTEDIYQTYQPIQKKFEYCGCRLSYLDQSVDHLITDLCWSLFTDSEIFTSLKKKKKGKKLTGKEISHIKKIAGNTGTGRTGDFLSNHFDHEPDNRNHGFKHSFVARLELPHLITLWLDAKKLTPKQSLKISESIFELFNQQGVITERDFKTTKAIAEDLRCNEADIHRIIDKRVEDLRSPREYELDYKGETQILDTKKILKIDRKHWTDKELARVQKMADQRASPRAGKITEMNNWKELSRRLTGAIRKYG